MALSIAVILVVGTIIFTLFVRAKDIPEPPPASPTAHLEERKAQIYENLRDLQFEFRVGKLSDSDYQKTKLDLQRELAQVLAEIDALQPAQAVQAPAQAVQAKVTKAPASGGARRRKRQQAGGAPLPALRGKISAGHEVLRRVRKGVGVMSISPLRALFSLALLAAPCFAVDGTVMNGTTGQPQPNAIVSLVQPGQGGMQTLYSVKTDAQGKFRFDKEPPPGPHPASNALSRRPLQSARDAWLGERHARPSLRRHQQARYRQSEPALYSVAT